MIFNKYIKPKPFNKIFVEKVKEFGGSAMLQKMSILMNINNSNIFEGN
jgi:hypothetical protein